MKLKLSRRWRTSPLAGAAKRARRLNSDEGSTLVEFAMTLPILVAVLTAVLSFSMFLFSMQQLSNATATAVQQVAANYGIASDPCAVAATSVTGSLPNWDPTKFTYTMWITNSSNQQGPTTGSASFSCTGGASEENTGSPIILKVSYSYTWFPILNFSPKTPLQVVQSAVAD